MATTWSGSLALTTGEVAIAETRVVVDDGDGFILTLAMDTPAFSLTCIYDGSRFFCENTEYSFIMSVVELDMFPLVRTYKVTVTFFATEDATTTAEWNITSGNANLEQSSLTAA